MSARGPDSRSCSTSGSSCSTAPGARCSSRRGLARRGLPRRALPRPPARRRRRPRPAQPDAAGHRARRPPRVPRGRRRHHDDEHLHGDVDRPGRLRARGRGLRDERRGRAARPAGGRRGRRPLRRRLGRPAERHALALAAGRRPGVPRGHVRRGRATRTPSRSRALAEGGVDLLLIETIFDTLNAKAAIAAAREVAPELPLWISVTIVDLSGRTLSGQTVEAFWTSIEHARPLRRRRQLLARRDARCARTSRSSRGVADTYTSCHPNAGLPNAFGGYDEQPDETAALLREFAEAGLVNVVGGCCGTTPEHTRAIAAAVGGSAAAPRPGAPARARASAASSRSRSARTPAS